MTDRREPATKAGRELLSLNPEAAIEFWPVLDMVIVRIEDEAAAPREAPDQRLRAALPDAGAEGEPQRDMSADEWRGAYMELARICEGKVGAAERERDLAVAHDRQPYPTAAAYEAVCRARDEWKARAQAAEAEGWEAGAAAAADRGIVYERRDKNAGLDVEALMDALDAVMPGLRGPTPACDHDGGPRYLPAGTADGDQLTPGDFVHDLIAEYARLCALATEGEPQAARHVRLDPASNPAWSVTDWHCSCGWWGNLGALGFRAHVVQPRREPRGIDGHRHRAGEDGYCPYPGCVEPTP